MSSPTFHPSVSLMSTSTGLNIGEGVEKGQPFKSQVTIVQAYVYVKSAAWLAPSANVCYRLFFCVFLGSRAGGVCLPVSGERHYRLSVVATHYSFNWGKLPSDGAYQIQTTPPGLLLTIFSLAYHSCCAFPQSTCVTTNRRSSSAFSDVHFGGCCTKLEGGRQPRQPRCVITGLTISWDDYRVRQYRPTSLERGY